MDYDSIHNFYQETVLFNFGQTNRTLKSIMIKTGYDILDHYTGGFHKGELISIIGRPLMGRTMFALNLYNKILLNGNNAAFLTSECPAYKAIELLNEMIGEGQPCMANKIMGVSGCKSVNDLVDVIRNLVKKDDVNVIILDSFHYLALFEDVATSFLYEKLADVTRRIKRLAKTLGITIIMTSRTNYMVDERESFQGMLPQLSDTNKMGDLAYYSDVVLGLYRPEVDSVYEDMKGHDLHDVLFVLVLKSRKAITDKFPAYSISPKNCCITEKKAVANKDAIMEEIDEDTVFISNVLVDKGIELWAFLREFNDNWDVTNLKKCNQPLFEGVMNILDLITISKGFQYELSSVHEAFSGYHTTITLQSGKIKEKDACYDDIAIGLETKEHLAITSMVIWQIYLFCKFYRGIDYAECYYGMPIFELSDLDSNKFIIAHGEDQERLKSAYSHLQVERSSILPLIISDGTNYRVKCTWWFPAKGLVQETIDYCCYDNKVSEYKSNQQVL